MYLRDGRSPTAPASSARYSEGALAGPLSSRPLGAWAGAIYRLSVARSPMKLEESYEQRFYDNTSYPPTTAYQLKGLAAAIQDSHPTWRPTLSELISIVKPQPNNRGFVAAGGAYGAGRELVDAYPGPAILLFGAALNAIGELPQVELESALMAATAKLQGEGLQDDPDIKTVVAAARERARFDKVGEMLRRDFREGLVASGKYSSQRVDWLVPRIVKATHQVRHEAFVNLAGWALSEPDEGRYYLDSSSTEDKAEFTDPFVEIDKGEAMAFGKPLFAELAGPARDGCAFSLMLRLQDLDVSHGA